MDDCFNIIFKYLDVADVVKWASVSKHFYDIANRNNIWIRLLWSNFAFLIFMDKPKMSYKRLYKLDTFLNKYNTNIKKIFYEKQQVLDLSYEQLNELPEEIDMIPFVKELNLSHNNLLSLPENICSLTQLHTLQLSNNQIKSLPENIDKLIQLRELTFNGNLIEYIPDNIALLTQLNNISYDNNPIKRKSDYFKLYLVQQNHQLNLMQLRGIKNYFGND